MNRKNLHMSKVLFLNSFSSDSRSWRISSTSANNCFNLVIVDESLPPAPAPKPGMADLSSGYKQNRNFTKHGQNMQIFIILHFTSVFDSNSNPWRFVSNFCLTILSAFIAVSKIPLYLPISWNNGSVNFSDGILVQRSLNWARSWSSDDRSSFNSRRV